MEKVFESLEKIKKVNIISEIIGELTHSEFMIMNLIHCNSKEDVADGVQISTLANLLMISNPAVSQMINIIEDKGYVERITTKTDRRIVKVRLTDSGKKLLEEALQSALKIAREIFEKMGEEDTNILLKLLDKLYLIADEYKKNR